MKWLGRIKAVTTSIEVEAETFAGAVEALRDAGKEVTMGIKTEKVVSLEVEVQAQLGEPWVYLVPFKSEEDPADVAVLHLERALGHSFDQEEIGLLRERLRGQGATILHQWSSGGAGRSSFALAIAPGWALTDERLAAITAPRPE